MWNSRTSSKASDEQASESAPIYNFLAKALSSMKDRRKNTFWVTHRGESVRMLKDFVDGSTTITLYSKWAMFLWPFFGALGTSVLIAMIQWHLSLTAPHWHWWLHPTTSLVYFPFAFVKFYVIMRHRQQERKNSLFRMLVIAEMNHRIRNALQLMQSAAFVSNQDTAYRDMISVAVNRIQVALTEVLPKVNRSVNSPACWNCDSSRPDKCVTCDYYKQIAAPRKATTKERIQ